MKNVVFQVHYSEQDDSYGNDIAVFVFDDKQSIDMNDIEAAFLEASFDISPEDYEDPLQRTDEILNETARTLGCEWSWLGNTYSAYVDFEPSGDAFVRVY